MTNSDMALDEWAEDDIDLNAPDWDLLNGWLAEAVRGESPLFHLTWKSRLASIRESGLKLGGTHRRGNNWMGGTETRERCRGYVFLTGDDRIDFWATMMCENLDLPTKGDHLVLLEIDPTGLPLEHDTEYPGDCRVGVPVGPERIRAVLETDPWLEHVNEWLIQRTQEEQRAKRAAARSAPTARKAAPKPAKKTARKATVRSAARSTPKRPR